MANWAFKEKRKRYDESKFRNTKKTNTNLQCFKVNLEQVNIRYKINKEKSKSEKSEMTLKICIGQFLSFLFFLKAALIKIRKLGRLLKRLQ